MTEIQHYQDGTIRAIGKINLDGNKFGIWKYFSISGNLKKDELYKDGRLISRTEYSEIGDGIWKT